MAHFALRGFLLGSALVIQSGAFAADVLTQHNDAGRTGAILDEVVLTPKSLREHVLKLFGTYAVKGQVYAQPLYAGNIASPDHLSRNVLYVATAANLVYAFDADRPGSPSLWTADVGSTHIVPSQEVYPFASTAEPADISNGLGIISTPVIDRRAGVIYLVAMTRYPDSEKEQHGGNPFVWTLYAVDLSDGHRHASIEIRNFDFNPRKQLQRAALTLANDRIYTAWSSFGDRTPSGEPDWNGWVIAFDADVTRGAFTQAEAFKVAPHKHQGGIWHSGGGMAVDDRGNLYAVTGNGHSDDGEAGVDFDSSDVKLTPELSVSDYYTPSFRGTLNGIQPKDDPVRADLDLSVSGPMIPPEWTDDRGEPVRRLLHGSKQGILYNVNRDGMGHLLSPSNQDPVQLVQVFSNPDPGDQMKAQHIHSTPVFWESRQDRRVFVASDWGLGIRAFRLDARGRLHAAAVASTSADFRSMTQMSLSANGKDDGILWAIGCVNCVDDLHGGPAAWHGKLGALTAFDALTLEQLFTAPVGDYPRFNAPTIAGGRVYVPTFSGGVAVFGLTTGNSAPCPGVSAGCAITEVGAGLLLHQ